MKRKKIMHDIKIIRKNPDIFLKKLSERNVIIDIKSLLDLDKKNRQLIQDKEKLEQEKKIISKKKDKNLFNQSKEVSIFFDKESRSFSRFTTKNPFWLNYISLNKS